MRPLLLLLLLMLPAGAIAADRAATPPASAANLLRYRPAPWRLPVMPARAALRFEPEAGETAEAPAASVTREENALRRAAEASVRTHADGSRHAVVGAAFRSFSVVTIDEQGRLLHDCVHDEAEARRRVEAAARKQVRR